MGKNHGAYKTAEGYWRLMAKVIFLDVKGGGTEESLRDMKCDLSRYHFHDLKQDGLPFPIFNLSAFAGESKEEYVNKEISVGGWIRSIRDSKTFGFITLNDGTSFKALQIVYSDELNNFKEIKKEETPKFNQNIIAKYLNAEKINVIFELNGIQNKTFECTKCEITANIIKKVLHEFDLKDNKIVLFIYTFKKLNLDIPIAENKIKNNSKISIIYDVQFE